MKKKLSMVRQAHTSQTATAPKKCPKRQTEGTGKMWSSKAVQTHPNPRCTPTTTFPKNASMAIPSFPSNNSSVKGGDIVSRTAEISSSVSCTTPISVGISISPSPAAVIEVPLPPLLLRRRRRPRTEDRRFSPDPFGGRKQSASLGQPAYQ